MSVLTPFLDAHKGINNHHFDLGQNLSPVSIKDQIIRGILCVENLISMGMITDSRPLLISGAGVAGISAAITASQKGIPTTINESKSVPLSRFSKCLTRHLCPTVYDWPSDHWNVRDISKIFDISFHTLNWNSVNTASPSQLATQFAFQFFYTLNNPGNKLLYSPETFVKKDPKPSFDLHKGFFDIQFEQKGKSCTLKPSHNYQFGAWITAIGFGRENTFWPDPQSASFSSLSFWENNDLTKPKMAINAVQPTVLISGGGDGGLQEYLRAWTRKTPFEIMQELLSRTDGSTQNAIKKAMHSIQSYEENHNRQLSWLHDSHMIKVLNKKLHDCHTSEVDKLKSKPSIWKNIRTIIANVIDSAIRDNIRVVLVHREPYFTRCYPINRFLTLLVHKTLHEVYPDLEPTVFPNYEIVHIKSNQARHHCDISKPLECYKKLHIVHLKHRHKNLTTNVRAHIILLRHGINSIDENYERKKHLHQPIPQYLTGF